MGNKLNSKYYITEALMQLMDKKDFNEITITDITKKAGVSRITFYRNFDSKDDILKKYLQKSFDDWKSECESIEEEYDLRYQIFRFFYEQSRIVSIIYKANLQLLLADEILNACGYNSDDSNILAYTKSIIGYMIFGWCNEWYKRGMQETPEQMIDLIKEFEKSEQNKNLPT